MKKAEAKVKRTIDTHIALYKAFGVDLLSP
jgi:hypothetical protein